MSSAAKCPSDTMSLPDCKVEEIRLREIPILQYFITLNYKSESNYLNHCSDTRVVTSEFGQQGGMLLHQILHSDQIASSAMGKIAITIGFNENAVLKMKMQSIMLIRK